MKRFCIIVFLLAIIILSIAPSVFNSNQQRALFTITFLANSDSAHDKEALNQAKSSVTAYLSRYTSSIDKASVGEFFSEHYIGVKNACVNALFSKGYVYGVKVSGGFNENEYSLSIVLGLGACSENEKLFFSTDGKWVINTEKKESKLVEIFRDYFIKEK